MGSVEPIPFKPPTEQSPQEVKSVPLKREQKAAEVSRSVLETEGSQRKEATSLGDRFSIGGVSKESKIQEIAGRAAVTLSTAEPVPHVGTTKELLTLFTKNVSKSLSDGSQIIAERQEMVKGPVSEGEWSKIRKGVLHANQLEEIDIKKILKDTNISLPSIMHEQLTSFSADVDRFNTWCRQLPLSETEQDWSRYLEISQQQIGELKKSCDQLIQMLK